MTRGEHPDKAARVRLAGKILAKVAEAVGAL
jgi:hypothetical protein